MHTNSSIKKAGLPGFIFLFHHKHISLFIIKRYTVNFVKIVEC